MFNDYIEAGGERQSVATEIKALREAGATVDSLVLTNDDLEVAGSVRRARMLIDSRSVVNALTQKILDFNPDIVHAENLFPRFGATSIGVLRKHQLPWVRTIRNYRKGCIAGTFERAGQMCTLCSGSPLSLHGIVHSCYKASKSSSAGATVLRARESSAELAYPPGAYITVSDSLRSRIAPDLISGVPVHTVYNAVSGRADRMPNDPTMREFDACYVGRLTKEKGVSTAIKIAQGTDIRFAFVGTGAESAMVADVAAEYPGRIVYFGGCTRDETMKVIESSKVLLAPSRWEEPFGRVAAEALSVGTLPLVADRGGLPEVVQGIGYAATVSGSDIRAWTTALNALLELDEDVLRIYSASARDLWNSKFSESALAQSLLAIYESVANSAR